MSNALPCFFKFAQKTVYCFVTVLFMSTFTVAQEKVDSAFKPSGNLWGLAYGDYAFKYKSDPLNRGGVNQYTGIKESESLFQFRRIYLGYDYQISKTFSSNFLLAHEENEISSANIIPTTSGDLLSNNKVSMFIKLASVTWNNILPKTNLTMGQQYTPASVLLSEGMWDYRCIERTISDIRRTPAYDFGIQLSGNLYDNKKTEIGYNLMIGNGNAAKPENDKFKWFYSDVYVKFLNKKMLFDIYADYDRMNWTSNWHHDRYMFKALLAYTTPKITVGAEAFYNTLRNDNKATSATQSDTLTTNASGISVFARGAIYKNLLTFFVRYDDYNPSINNKNGTYTKYTALTPTYDPNTKEQFFTAGIDYSPINKIHIMPNVWYNNYTNAGPVANSDGYDLVYRLSLYYVYGK